MVSQRTQHDALFARKRLILYALQFLKTFPTMRLKGKVQTARLSHLSFKFRHYSSLEDIATIPSQALVASQNVTESPASAGNSATSHSHSPDSAPVEGMKRCQLKGFKAVDIVFVDNITIVDTKLIESTATRVLLSITTAL
jgi:hypothetical protein